MKKALLLTISVLLVLTLSLCITGCGTDGDGTEVYTLDISDFESTAAFGEELGLAGLKLVNEKGETVTVSTDMVSGIDTASAGDKEFTVVYNGQTFTVKYSVKYRVTFVIDGSETVQLVSSVDQIKLPEPPAIPGKQFDRWSMTLPTTLTDNIKIDAIYKSLSGAREDAYSWSGEGVIDLSGYAENTESVVVSITDEAGNSLEGSASAVVEDGKIRYSMLDSSLIVVSISGEGVLSKSWRVTKVDEPTLSLADGADAIGITLGANRYSAKINTGSTPVSFKYQLSIANTNVSAAESNGYIFIDVVKAGVTELAIKAVNATNALESLTLTQYVVVAPATVTAPGGYVHQNAIEQIWTVGRYNADKLPALTVGVNAEKVGEGFYENITWVSGNENVVISADGKITLKDVSVDPEIVEIKAVFGYKGISFESAPVKVRCVYNGVNVYNYSELYSESVSSNPRPVVLQNNIKDDFSSTNFTWMESTYDLTYYHNIGKSGTDTRVKVLLKIKSDLYGNGYEINAHNATLGTLDATGKPTDATLFRGPLNFVAMSESGGAISVKAQDNIVFAIYENVTVNNVVLKSCDLEAYDGTVDLTDLEYAGTTVEVLGDNVTVEYSRLMNGRTVLRIFGDETDAQKEIHVTVKNTVIKASREFNARIGSNRFEFDASTASPLLPGDAGADYKAKQNYNNMSRDEKAAYDDKYINTFVTFENVVFEDAGIFAIGIDTHFAGEALKDGSNYFEGALVGWKDLAKTSYGAKVTLKDDVRLYSWKPLDDINSDTLIENTLASDGTGDGTLFANIRFNVKEIIRNAAKTEGYSNLIYNYGGEDYVHAGIVFFGGGKNYGIVENLITSSFNHKFSEYNVTLRELEGQGYLETASGSEAFYFLVYNKDSTFTYETQLTMTNKYDCLYN